MNSVSNTIFYEINSRPLLKVMACDMIAGRKYINERGDVVRFSGNDIELSYFDFIRRTELVDGELMENLTDTQLDLFWRLTENNKNRTTPYESDIY